MAVLGSFQPNDFLSSSKQPLKILRSLLAVVVFLTLVLFFLLASTSCFGLPSSAQQEETHALEHRTDEAKSILYFFTARWCEPCHKVQPFVERLCKKHSKAVDLAFIDFDSDRELVESFQVKRIPAFVLLDSKRRLVFRAEDARQETLEALTKAVEKLNPTGEKAEEPEIPHPRHSSFTTVDADAGGRASWGVVATACP